MDRFAVLYFVGGVKSDDVREVLRQAGARQKEEFPYEWVLPTSDVPKGLARELESRALSYDLRFKIQPGRGEPVDRIAGFPLLAAFDEHPFSDDLVMAKLEGTSRLVCSEAFLERVGEMTSGLVLHELEENDGFYVVDPPELPDPIVVPRALRVFQAEDGTRIVRSDGRELLTDRNGAVLREVGIARAPRCSIEGRTYDWKRVPALSGRVLSVIDEAETIGVLGAPAYLGWVDEV